MPGSASQFRCELVPQIYGVIPAGVKKKKVLKYLGIGILSVVIFFLGIAIFTSSKSVDHEMVFLPYIVKVMPELSTWEQKAYKDNMSKEVCGGITRSYVLIYYYLFVHARNKGLND